MEKNGTPASPATARAKSVLPVPGGPKSRTPLGIRAPKSLNFFGCFRNSTTSSSSCFASSAPATSLKLTFTLSAPLSRARLLPNDITRPPPPCVCCMMKNQTPTRIKMGKRDENICIHHGGSGGFFALISTFFSCKRGRRVVSILGTFGVTAVNSVPSFKTPSIVLFVMVTCMTSPLSTSCKKAV